jgi:hypothetical protein
LYLLPLKQKTVNRKSFKSKRYPRNRNRLFITQEYAMEYYGMFTLVVMLGVMVAIANGNMGRGLLAWALIGEVLALLLANGMAYGKLKRSYAQIQFINDHFSLISVHDILHENAQHAFPLKYANPSRGKDFIQLHYNDQIVQLKEEDWGEDFEMIWSWLVAEPPPQGGSGWQVSIS